MSTADIDLLGPPQADDLLHPEFAVVLRGYDPEEVRGYVVSVAEHVESLQEQLRDSEAQIDLARRQYAAAREAAYKQLATRMAELLQTADAEADRLRREGAEDASRRIAEADRRAEHTRRESEEAAEALRRESEDTADSLRRQGEEMLWRARAEADRILGGLAVRRDEMLGELDATRQRLTSVVTQLEQTIATTREEAERAAVVAAREVASEEAGHDSTSDDGEGEAAVPGTTEITASGARPTSVTPEGGSAANGQVEDSIGEADPPATEAQGAAPVAKPPRSDELLESIEGFDLVIPDVRLDDDEL